MTIGITSSSLYNPGAKKNVSMREMDDLNVLTARTQVNQVKGIQPAAGVGSGLPMPVTSVRAVLQKNGANTDVTILFTRNPQDQNFQRALVLVKNYKGNPQPTQVASGSESPIRFPLENTGENVLFLIQVEGNAGSHALASSLTTGTRLPR